MISKYDDRAFITSTVKRKQHYFVQSEFNSSDVRWNRS